MAAGSNRNNITKAEAIAFMKGKAQAYVVNDLVETTLYGKEYQDDWKYNELEMSYFCRAFNITEYGASRSRNRIKGRYGKYKAIEGLERYYRQILEENWPGFREEEPRIDILLEEFASSIRAGDTPEVYEENDDWKERVPSGAGACLQGFGNVLKKDSGQKRTEDNIPVEKLAGVVGVAIVGLAALVLIFKLIAAVLSGLNGVAGVFGDLMREMNLWEILSFLSFYGGIIYGIVLLVTKRPKRKLFHAVAVFEASFLFEAFSAGDQRGTLIRIIIVAILFALGKNRGRA